MWIFRNRFPEAAQIYSKQILTFASLRPDTYPAMKEFTLDLGEEIVSEKDIQAIALHAPGIPSYQLVHYINKNLDWKLCHTQRYYQPGIGWNSSLEIFSHVNELDRLQWLLVNNQDEKGVWIQAAPEVNYWLILTGTGLEFHDMENTLDRLGKIPILFYACAYPWHPKGKNAKSRQVFKQFQDFYLNMEEQQILFHFD